MSGPFRLRYAYADALSKLRDDMKKRVNGSLSAQSLDVDDEPLMQRERASEVADYPHHYSSSLTSSS